MRAPTVLALLLLVLPLAGWHYPCRQVLDEPAYKALVQRMRAEAMDDDKVYALRLTADVSWMSCAQVVSLLPLLAWREGRLHGLEVSAQAIVDRQNAASIVAAFPSEDQERAKELLLL